MAANDYYTSFSPNQQHGNPPNRTDAPLPAVPGNQSQQSISPVASPFDDRRYEYPSTQNLAQNQAPLGYSDTSYHGAAPGHPNRYDSPSHSTDPFADQNAIPLHDQGKMHSQPYINDPEARMYGQPEKRKKKGWFSGRITWVVYILTTVQIGVFIGEIVNNAVLTKSPIQTKPQFNIMIGPSPYVLINMGARYPPCMHNIRGVTDYKDPIQWPCPNSTNTDYDCTLKQLCGMGSGVPEQKEATPFDDRSNEPNQWWRFIVPIFLHAGLIHIGFNMLLQLTLGRDMEKEIGPLRFALVYFSSGIFGFVLGGNYAAPNIPSVGASGSLFGILALVLLDLLYHWSQRRSPVKDLLFLFLDIAIAFVLGLLPGLDNFSHIGGFLMGLVLGICLLHSPQALRERIGVDEPPYSAVEPHVMSGGSGETPIGGTGGAGGVGPGISKFVKKPVGFFKGRKPLWWAWWLARAGALVAVFIGFILLLRNFYEWRQECSWCHHLSCLPIKDWCDIGNFKLQEIDKNDNNQTRRMMARDIFGI